MEKGSGSGVNWGVIVTFVNLGVLLLAKESTAQGEAAREEYACWGGCYNQCFLLQSQEDMSQRLPCYLDCLGGCTVRPERDAAADHNNLPYCQLGCSLLKCIRYNPDGKKAGKCLDHCSTKICAHSNN